MYWTPLAGLFVLLTASTALATPLNGQVALGQDGPMRTTDSWNYVDCGVESYPVQIESINVIPDPPQPGKDLTVKVKAKVLEVIEEGAYADVVVKLGLVKLLQKTFDICEEARNANATIQCPVEVGTYDIEQTVTLPNEIPRAKFTIDVSGYTAEDDDMICLRLVVNFMKNPFPHS